MRRLKVALSGGDAARESYMVTKARWLEASSIDIGIDIDIYVLRTSKRVSFKLRFHEIPALHEENKALHIP